jgi:hypothetical protein
MAKLKVYEIDAIVQTVVSKINDHKTSQITEPSKKEIDELKRKHMLHMQAEKEYDKSVEKFNEKYPAHSISTWSYGKPCFEVEINKHKIEVDWSVKEKIKNQIIMSQVTGNDVEKLIDSIVKEHTK